MDFPAKVSRTMSDSQETRAILERFVDEACLSLFGAYGVDLKRVAVDHAPRHDVLYCGIVGLTGQNIRATCILAATEEPISQSSPIPSSARDWVAELSNQLIGRIKNKLVAYGAEAYVSMPVVLRGEHLAPIPQQRIRPFAYGTAGGGVFLWVEFETSPDFVLGMPTDGAVMSEGEALLF